MIGKNAISVVYGWNNPKIGEKEKYKVLISKYYTDINLDHSSEKLGFKQEKVNDKIRIYAQDDKELSNMKAKLNKMKLDHIIKKITLTTEQKLIINECEKKGLSVDEVRKKLNV